MTPHRTLNILAGCLLAMVIGTSLDTSHLLDDSNISDEAATAQAVEDAQADAQAAYIEQQREALMERAADAQCIRMHGPAYRHRWTDGGDLTCIQPNGRAAVVASTGI